MKPLHLVTLAVCLLLTAVIGWSFLSATQRPDPTLRVAQCYEDNQADSEKINCWFSMIREVFIQSGTEEAFALFEQIYQEYDTFSDTGCHRHAHRVGDLAYYYDYLQHLDLSLMEFPRNAVACGYGFYHGFFEHLVQDNPDVDFVTRTCEYLNENITTNAPAISQTCYHGAGHGFVLAEVDRLSDPKVWSANAFALGPLEQCGRLSSANEFEISECRQGVFNVIADWMADQEYGLVYDSKNSFGFCDTQEVSYQRDCYYEMAQKIGLIAGLSPLKVLAVTETLARPDLRELIIDVAVAGMVQHNPKGDQRSLLSECRELPVEFFSVCFKAIIGGLMEHNTAGTAYGSAFDFCAGDHLIETERELCYATLSSKLERFYTKEEIKVACEAGTYPELLCKNR